MSHRLARTFVSSALMLAVAHTGGITNAQFSMNMEQTETLSSTSILPNPLLDKWAGPYGGIPPFDKVKVADFKPGLEAAMAEDLAEIDKIAKNPEAPNFENTVAAMEPTATTATKATRRSRGPSKLCCGRWSRTTAITLGRSP